MSDIREPLRPFLTKRIPVRGTFVKLINDPNGVRAYIRIPETDEIRISDHICVMSCLHWQNYRYMEGKEIEFEAIVNEYQYADGTWNFGLRNPSNPKLILPPFLAIPDPPSKKQTKLRRTIRPNCLLEAITINKMRQGAMETCHPRKPP